MKNFPVFFMQLFIIVNILNRIFCVDKPGPSSSVNKATKNVMMKTSMGMTSKATEHFKSAQDIVPEKKSTREISKNQPKVMGKTQKPATGEETKTAGKKPIELMPCYRGKSTKINPMKDLPTNSGSANLSKSVDFENYISREVKQPKMIVRQQSKSMDLELDEFLRKHEQIQRNRRRLEQMEKARIKKEAQEASKLARKAYLINREKMWGKQKIVPSQKQDKKPKQLAPQQNPNKTAIRSKHPSAATNSNQIDERKQRIGGGTNIKRKIGGKRRDTMASSSPTALSENVKKTEEEVEEAVKTFLSQLHQNIEKVPRTLSPDLLKIIEYYVEKYKEMCELFAECMRKILRANEKDHGAVKRINEFKTEVKNEIDTLQKSPNQPLEKFKTRDWLNQMKEDSEYMLLSLNGREN